jgi:hypothetical protein
MRISSHRRAYLTESAMAPILCLFLHARHGGGRYVGQPAPWMCCVCVCVDEWAN